MFPLTFSVRDIRCWCDWYKMWQIRDFFRSDFSTFWLEEPKCTEIWSEKLPDLSQLGPSLTSPTPSTYLSLSLPLLSKKKKLARWNVGGCQVSCHVCLNCHVNCLISHFVGSTFSTFAYFTLIPNPSRMKTNQQQHPLQLYVSRRIMSRRRSNYSVSIS